jgi:hypothetical protein
MANIGDLSRTSGGTHANPFIQLVMDDDGIKQLKDLDRRLTAVIRDFSSEHKIEQILTENAGRQLYAAALSSLETLVYDLEATPVEGNSPIFAVGDIYNAHEIIMLGPNNVMVRVNPDEPVSDGHSGKGTVGDYAHAVHDGYIQWVFGRSTGVFHPGRPWMDYAWEMAKPAIFKRAQVTAETLLRTALIRGGTIAIPFTNLEKARRLFGGNTQFRSKKVKK